MKRFTIPGVSARTPFRNAFSQYFLLALLNLTLVTGASSAELVVNGGFEEPVVPHIKGWSTYYGQNASANHCDNLGEEECNGGTLIPGWSAIWTDTLGITNQPGRVEIQRDNPPLPPVANCPAFEGRQKVELDSHHRGDNDENNVTIFQGLKTCPRSPYVFIYHWKARLQEPGNSDLDVLIDETVLRVHRTFGDDWDEEIYHFISGDTNLTALAFQSVGDSNTLGVFLDGISVQGADGSEPAQCDEPEPICGEKPLSLTLLYDGDFDGVDHYTQSGNDVIVNTVGGASFPRFAKIRVFDHKRNRTELFNEIVEMGSLFEVSGPKKRIPPKLRFEIYSIDDFSGALELVQTVQFHTSCSQPLSVGDEFGAITVWSATQ